MPGKLHGRTSLRPKRHNSLWEGHAGLCRENGDLRTSFKKESVVSGSKSGKTTIKVGKENKKS